MRSSTIALLLVLSGCDIVAGLAPLEYDLETSEDDQPEGCIAPAVSCGEDCVDLQTSLEHCGRCDAPCRFDNAEASCVAGQCMMGDCLGAFVDCNDDVEDGCEVDVETDPDNCGTCNFVCPVDGSAPHTTAACADSVCTTVCEDGWGDCDADIGCETDTTITADSCGSCGHDCLGGACTGGVCQPLTLATGQTPRVLALDGSYLYWNVTKAAPDGRILRIDTSGNGSLEIVVDGLHLPGSFAVDTTNVYVAVPAQGCTNDAQACIVRSLKSSTDTTVGAERATSIAATGMVAADGFVYFREGAQVRSLPSTLTGTATVLADVPESGGGTELILSTDGTTLFWGDAAGTEAQAWRAATDGSGAEAIATLNDWPISITQLGGDLFFTGVSGGLDALPASAMGDAVSPVTSSNGSYFGSATSIGSEVAFLANDEPLRWVRPDAMGTFSVEEGMTVSMQLDFGPGTVPVVGDTAAIYWAELSTGTIKKLAR
ncbi:MAG TPA: hypothetical protein ENK57_25175 [Polyangiaceae bacterium]|nr:hypothetical protein [Polyangiaceae bacterium]